MVLENREPCMAPHSKVALDIAATADALFMGDAQRHHGLLCRLQDARNYAENLDPDDTDPVLIPAPDIVQAALIVISRLAYADFATCYKSIGYKTMRYEDRK